MPGKLPVVLQYDQHSAFADGCGSINPPTSVLQDHYTVSLNKMGEVRLVMVGLHADKIHLPYYFI